MGSNPVYPASYQNRHSRTLTPPDPADQQKPPKQLNQTVADSQLLGARPSNESSKVQNPGASVFPLAAGFPTTGAPAVPTPANGHLPQRSSYWRSGAPQRRA